MLTPALLLALFLTNPAPAGAQILQQVPEESIGGKTVKPVSEPAGAGTNAFFSEPWIISKPIAAATALVGDETGRVSNGFYPELSNMITGSGVLSVGPGYRHFLLHDRLFVDTSTAVSWHFYQMAQVRAEFFDLFGGHFAIGAQSMWQDNKQISYYGQGRAAVHADQSQYRLVTTDASAYATIRPIESLAIAGEFGWLDRPQVLATAGTFNPDYPATQTMYPDAPGINLAYQPHFLRGELSIAGDTRDYHSHPTRGGLYRVAAVRYADRSYGMYTFNQYEGELAQYVPLFDSRVVLAGHAWAVFSDVKNGNDIPFYLLPMLGGNNTLRAYDDYQFHDRNLLVANGEARIAVWPHMDFALFYDAGNVASYYRDLNLDKYSYGAGLRFHTKRETFARLDVAYGPEGWRFVARTNDPLKLSRLSRKLAAIPFMP